MIDKLRLLVLKVQWLKPITLVTGLLSLALIAYILIIQAGSTANDYLLLPAVITLLWSAMTFWLLYTFPGVPEKATKATGFFKRIGIHFQRFFYCVLAVIALLATVAIVIFTFRGLSVWLQSYS
ncbi:hypothetical protein SG34_017620 [Thalassomonas viridans]|uniref:Uncharacterized protein n=1 Tax=Thalassomonas viridans TaxID=137584 RepID=A0AAE9YZC1_9GAMM|nr:hypothetical protein [Thalassomonas viridans]WDE03215.1 hypothetical protein SG34_017620 [Thalassomonas viridans]